MSAIPQHQAILFQNTMNSLSPWNRSLMRDTLARVSDDRFVAIINHLSFAMPQRLRHYVCILGSHDSTRGRPKIDTTEPTVQRPNANEASVLSSEELRLGLQKLPKELCDAIESAFIKDTLAPGFIFPDQAPGPDGKHLFFGSSFEPTRYEVLLGLNRENYLVHGAQFWSNLFVIGKGPAWFSMRWLERMHDDVKAKVRNVYISLSRDDNPERSNSRAEYLARASDHGGILDPLGSMQLFDSEVVDFNTTLQNRWYRKMMCLKHLKLERLIIDVRDAFGLDDTFVGLSFMRTMPPFVNKPQSAKIIANDDALAAAMLSVFWARNSQ